jgi:multimeric flavodoxin WrbA
MDVFIANIRSLSSILLCNKTELCQTTKLDLNTIDEVIKETSLIILSGKVYTGSVSFFGKS